MSYISTCRNEENFANEIIASLRITMVLLSNTSPATHPNPISKK